MLTSIQSAGVAPEVNLRTSAQARKCASQKSNLALKPSADVTRSPKQGNQWPHKKYSCPTKILKKDKRTKDGSVKLGVYASTQSTIVSSFMKLPLENYPDPEREPKPPDADVIRLLQLYLFACGFT